MKIMPNNDVYATTNYGAPLDLKELQLAVGGPIEIIGSPANTLPSKRTLVFVVNEEGKIYKLPHNSIASIAVAKFGHPVWSIVGPVVVAVLEQGGALVNLTETEETNFLVKLSKWVRKEKLGSMQVIMQVIP